MPATSAAGRQRVGSSGAEESRGTAHSSTPRRSAEIPSTACEALSRGQRMASLVATGEGPKTVNCLDSEAVNGQAISRHPSSRVG